MRAFERALRRTALPLRMSEGFHPKPRISFPAPLGVGIESTDEVMEFDLAEWVHPSQIEARLAENLPEGINLLALEFGSPKQVARATGVTYRIHLSGDLRSDERLSAASLGGIMARQEIPVSRVRKRKQKTVDIRPFMIALRRAGDAIVMEVTAGPGGSTRPEEVLGILGFDEAACRSRFPVTRTCVKLATRPGELGRRPGLTER